MCASKVQPASRLALWKRRQAAQGTPLASHAAIIAWQASPLLFTLGMTHSPLQTEDSTSNKVRAASAFRSFEAPAPNRKWIADFTYVWTAEGWLYVAAVVDLFSRRVVGWSMNTAMTAQLVTDALVMAIWRRGKPDALLHHSDRGSQYTSEQFQRLMTDHGVVCSMSRSGNVWDNAAMESFFSSLKTERTARKNYRSRDEAKADVFDYIESFYNPKRRHSTIGYMSPMEFERQAGLA
jgi:putative transposase